MLSKKYSALLLLFTTYSVLPACSESEEPQASVDQGAPAEEEETEPEWIAYEVSPPTEEMLPLLQEVPYLYPVQSCTPLEEGAQLPENATISVDEDGQDQLCIWNSVVGTVPEGESFAEVMGCERVWTQAPGWFTPPRRIYRSDPAELEDENLANELRWVTDQALSGGCSCCHASGSPSNYATGWDLSAPLVWTDTLENYQLAMLSGIFDEHRELSGYPAAENHGFDRQHTMFPTTDPDRMRAFFTAELERRGATPEEIEAGREGVQTFFGRRKVEDKDCVNPYEGLVEGQVAWNGGTRIRQFYVLEQDAEIPGFPPFNDRPEGIVWAFYLDPDAEDVGPGEITLGELPPGAMQVEPADGSAPEFIEGRSYRLYATPDFMLRFAINCMFSL